MIFKKKLLFFYDFMLLPDRVGLEVSFMHSGDDGTTLGLSLLFINIWLDIGFCIIEKQTE